MVITKVEIETLIRKHWRNTIRGNLTFYEEISNHGSDNVIFETEDGEKYVFRVIFMHPDIIHDGSQIYIALHHAGIPVPLPVLTDGGEYTIPAEIPDRQSGYSIHTFAEGDEEIDKSLLGGYINHLAEELGKFHTALYNIDVYDLDLKGREMTHFQSTNIGFHSPLEDHIPDQPLIQEMYHFWIKWRDSLDLSQFTSGIVHGDIGPGCNIMMKDQQVSAFIDLIGVGGGLYMTDVASFVMYGQLFEDERDGWLEKFKKYYLTTAPVSEQEFELLPFFLLWRFLIQALYFGWRIRVNYTQGNTPDSDNHDGMGHALWVLQFWKEKYRYLIF